MIEPLAFHNLPEQLAKSMTAHFLELKKGDGGGGDGGKRQNEAPFPGRKIFFSSAAERKKSRTTSLSAASAAAAQNSEINETEPEKWAGEAMKGEGRNNGVDYYFNDDVDKNDGDNDSIHGSGNLPHLIDKG